MRIKLLLLLLACLAVSIETRAQTPLPPAANTSPAPPDCEIGPFTVNTAGVDPQSLFDNRKKGCVYWTLEEFTNGALAPAVTVQFERADDNGGVPMTFANWPAPDIENTALGALTNLQNIDFNAGQLTYYRFYPWVHVNIVSLGSGPVTYHVLGYTPKGPAGTPTTSAAGAPGNDLCANPGVRKTVAINVIAAGTTAIFPVSGTASTYICGGMLIIASSATTADTALIEYGTGTACASVTKTLTGNLGAGIAPTTGGQSGLVVPLGEFGPSAFGNGACLVAAGTTVNIQGWVTGVQQ